MMGNSLDCPILTGINTNIRVSRTKSAVDCMEVGRQRTIEIENHRWWHVHPQKRSRESREYQWKEAEKKNR